MSPEASQNRSFRSARALALSNFARTEFEEYSSSLVQNLTRNKQLAEMFGYPYVSSVVRILQEAGLSEGRAQAFREIEKYTLPPSRELAWLIGCLAGGGYNAVSAGQRHILFTTPDENLLKAIKTTGENIFGINADYHPSQFVGFYNSRLARALGDLRGNVWPATISDKHGWILENSRYGWGFLEGFFDTHGYARAKRRRDGVSIDISFSAGFTNVASFLTGLLVSLGVEKPLIDQDKKAKESIHRVKIANLKDAKLIANNIHAHVKSKEATLEEIRNRMSRYRQYIRISSNRDLISEWARMEEMLNHPPNINEIKSLRKTGKTKYGPEAYVYRFGEGSFPRASIFLSTHLTLERYEVSTGKQVHYVHKQHFPHDYNARDRLNELLSKTYSGVSNEILLFGPSGQPLLVTKKYE